MDDQQGIKRAQERKYSVAWLDETMHAKLWWERASVKPDEAAKLLVRIDPLERDLQGNAPDPENICADGNPEWPGRYRALNRAFEDTAETEPKPRTLLNWLCVAMRAGLPYHQWIEEYYWLAVYVESLDDAGGTAVKVGVGGTAGDWHDKARSIADECFATDTANNCRDSLVRKGKRGITGGYAYCVMEIMQQRKIHGPRGLGTPTK